MVTRPHIKKNLRQSAFICGLFVLVNSSQAADAKKITYDDHVRPIFADRCLTCHNPDKAKGGLDLTTYSALLQGGSSGEIVAAGSPGDSRIYKSVTHAEEPKMPPKGEKLTKARLDLIRAWIAGGLLENSGSKAKIAKKPAFDMKLAETPTGKPEGPPPMPEHLVLEPVVETSRAGAAADIVSSPWAPLIALAVPRQVLLYNSESLRLAGVLEFPGGNPATLAFSRNGSILIAGGGRGGKNGKIIGWEVKSGKRVFEIGAEFDAVLAADITADHSLVALGGPGRRIKIYSTSTGEEVKNIKKHTDWLTALAFSPDGVLLATGDRNGGLHVWETGTGNPFYTLKAHSKAITAISWRADSNVVASASEDGSLRLWEMHGGKQIKSWTAHGGGVLDMAYTGDGTIVSCGRDRSAKVWDGNGGQKAATNSFTDIPVAACLSHDGKHMIVADWSGAVQAFNSADGKPIGKLIANPPTIAKRILRAAETIAEKEKAFTSLQQVHTAAIAAATASNNALAMAKANLAVLEKEKAQSSEAIGALKGKVAENKKAREAVARQTSEQAGRITAIESEIAAAAKKLEEFKKSLAAARTAHDQSRKDLAACDTALRDAETKLKAEETTVSFVTARIDESTQLIKIRETEHAAAAKAESDAKAKAEPAKNALESARRDHQFWTAAAVNLERHNKAKVRASFDETVADANAGVAEARKAAEAAGAATAKAQKSLDALTAATMKRRQELIDLRKRLPEVAWDLRLSRVIADQKRIAADNIREAMAKAPESILLKARAAVEATVKELELANNDSAKIEDILKNGVSRAKAALKLSREEEYKARRLLSKSLAAQNDASAALIKAEVALKAANESLAKFEAELAEITKRYLALLPKES